jgi:hypothetical protein
MGSDEEGEMAGRAAAIASEAAGVEPSGAPRAYPVRRLDRPDSTYYLVLLEDAVAAVDVESDHVLSWAKAARPTLVVDRDRARDLAALGQEAAVGLVWQSSVASRSPLYPFWEVRRGEEVVYVDQQRKLWRELPPSGHGG